MATPDSLLHSQAGPQWKKIGVKPYQGINTPLFSIRSHQSGGIGEFLDLKLLIDWLSPLGFNVIQLLPIYASGQDPSPYNAISANALNPIYLTLRALPYIENHPDLIQAIDLLSRYNSSPKIQYLEVKEEKDKILRAYAERELQHFAQDPHFQNFLNQNPWVIPYAKFKALKRRNGGKNWTDWPKDQETDSLQSDINGFSLIQFLAYEQMSSIKTYADQKNVLLMGDIPILVSPDSADVWNHPELFDLSMAAGAPPDMYNQEGQKWGFPPYNYEALKKEDFRFWKERLSCASRLYHLFRIDHIVGFFRIWAMGKDNKATDGHFDPKDEAKWMPQGNMMLDLMLANSPMLPIGEDLGVVPNATRALMKTLGIPGTKVIIWERNWNTDKSFIPFSKYPLDSLTTVSTHDSEPITEWWIANPEDAKLIAQENHWDYSSPMSSEQLFQILKASHHTSSLFHINLLQEYLSLFPELTWGHPESERINFPGIVSPSNWTYRYKLPIEDIAAHKPLTAKLQEMLQ
jgi:4-alpha-glucanotransferase